MNRLILKRLKVAGLAATASLAACQSQAQALAFTDIEKAAVTAEIRAVRDAYFQAATTFDAEAMATFLDKDFIHISNSRITPIDPAELAEAWTPLSHIEMDISTDSVVALTRDSGYTIYVASYVVYDTAGAAVDSSDWAGTHIWIRTDEGWKVQLAQEGRPAG